MFSHIRFLCVALLLLAICSPTEVSSFARIVQLYRSRLRPRKRPSSGFYRDSDQAAAAKIAALEQHNAQLEEDLAKAREEIQKREQFIVSLPVRGLWGLTKDACKRIKDDLKGAWAARPRIPPMYVALAGATMATVGAPALLVYWLDWVAQPRYVTTPRPVPVHRTYAYTGPPFIIRVQLTTGGEVTDAEIEAERWEWRCQHTNRWFCHLTADSPRRFEPWEDPIHMCRMEIAYEYPLFFQRTLDDGPVWHGPIIWPEPEMAPDAILIQLD